MTVPRCFYRMPLGFGPMPGPRQSAQGSALTGWAQVEAKTCTITFRAPKDQLASFLPRPCFEIVDGLSSNDDVATASISFTKLRNLPWLAGRGYSHCGLYIHGVACHGADETVEGKYLSVLFENMADPIISGREELGYAKVFSSLEDVEDGTDFTLRIGWDGATFGEMKLGSLAAADKIPSSNNCSEGSVVALSSQASGILHYKYIPRTGCPGTADAEYPTYSPTPAPSASAIEKTLMSNQPSLSFKALGFSQLPTLHHVAAKLAAIDIQEIVDARMTISNGTTDIKEQRAIRI